MVVAKKIKCYNFLRQNRTEHHIEFLFTLSIRGQTQLPTIKIDSYLKNNLKSTYTSLIVLDSP